MATGAFESTVDFITGMAAGADLTGKRHHLMTMDTNGNVVPAGAGAFCMGPLNAEVKKAGQAVNVAFQGIARVVAGAAFANKTLLASNAAGRAVAATGAAYVIGYALTPATADGDVVTMVITNAGPGAAS